MRVAFKNLGPIRRTELDVRPLTVITGPNNSGKTLVAHAIHGLWHGLRQTSGTVNPRRDGVLRLWDSLVAGVAASQALAQHRVLDATLVDLETWWELNQELVLERARAHKVPVEVNDDGEVIVRDPAQFKRAAFIVPRLALEEVFAEPFLLPAERNTLVIVYKLLSDRRYRILRQEFRLNPLADTVKDAVQRMHEQGDVRYPEAVERFLDFLADVELEVEARVESEPVAPVFHALADLVEAQVQAGNRLFFEKTTFAGRELQVGVPDGPAIGLHNASGSLKQLAPYLLFLRYRARRGAFLLIDEPEMNLHPETQARLLESLAILVGLGVQVLITTHSPGLLEHLGELTRGQAGSLRLDDRRALLRRDQVAVYEMRGSELVSLADISRGDA